MSSLLSHFPTTKGSGGDAPAGKEGATSGTKRRIGTGGTNQVKSISVFAPSIDSQENGLKNEPRSSTRDHVPGDVEDDSSTQTIATFASETKACSALLRAMSDMNARSSIQHNTSDAPHLPIVKPSSSFPEDNATGMDVDIVLRAAREFPVIKEEPHPPISVITDDDADEDEDALFEAFMAQERNGRKALDGDQLGGKVGDGVDSVVATGGRTEFGGVPGDRDTGNSIDGIVDRTPPTFATGRRPPLISSTISTSESEIRLATRTTGNDVGSSSVIPSPVVHLRPSIHLPSSSLDTQTATTTAAATPQQVFPGISEEILLTWASPTLTTRVIRDMIDWEDDRDWEHRLGPDRGNILIRKRLTDQEREFLIRKACQMGDTEDEPAPEWVMKLLEGRLGGLPREGMGMGSGSGSAGGTKKRKGRSRSPNPLAIKRQRARSVTPLFMPDPQSPSRHYHPPITLTRQRSESTESTPSIKEITPSSEADESIIVPTLDDDEEVLCTGGWSLDQADDVSDARIEDRRWARTETMMLREAVLRHGQGTVEQLKLVKKYMDAATRSGRQPKWSLKLLKHRWTEESAALREQCACPVLRSLRKAVFYLGEEWISRDDQEGGGWDAVASVVLGETGRGDVTGEILQSLWEVRPDGDRARVLNTTCVFDSTG